MMKKVLFTAIAGMMAYGAMGQACVPDVNYQPTSETGAGIKDLPCAVTNEPYNESTTIVIPTEVPYELGGNTIDVTVCEVKIDSITNFPQSSNLNYTVYYNNNSVGLGTWIVLTQGQVNRACVNVGATFTSSYNDSLLAHGQVKIGLTGCGSAFPVSFTALTPDGQPLKIGFTVGTGAELANCASIASIEETISNNSFDVAQNYPNPFSDNSQIAINLTEAGKVNFRVTNLVGKVVSESSFNANAGLSYINVNAADYAAGVYMYSVTANGKTITKRMIVK